jgi:hypothetical protein
MNSEPNRVRNQLSIGSIIGYVLLIPPVLSVFLFIAQMLDARRFLPGIWIGNNALYLAAMAIAAAYLIKGRSED